MTTTLIILAVVTVVLILSLLRNANGWKNTAESLWWEREELMATVSGLQSRVEAGPDWMQMVSRIYKGHHYFEYGRVNNKGDLRVTRHGGPTYVHDAEAFVRDYAGSIFPANFDSVPANTPQFQYDVTFRRECGQNGMWVAVAAHVMGTGKKRYFYVRCMASHSEAVARMAAQVFYAEHKQFAAPSTQAEAGFDNRVVNLILGQGYRANTQMPAVDVDTQETPAHRLPTVPSRLPYHTGYRVPVRLPGQQPLPVNGAGHGLRDTRTFPALKL